MQYYFYFKYKFKKVNIVLHSVIHDLQFYNKTLTRRRQNQIRDTLRVEEVFDKASSLERDVYNNVLTCYKESPDIKTREYLHSDCGCSCHISSKSPVFHNANCVSKCEASNLSFKNYLLNNGSGKNVLLDSPLLDKPYGPKEDLGLTGETMFSENNKFINLVSSIFNQVKGAISPKIDKLINYNKDHKKDASAKDIDMETGYFESIKILRSPEVRIDMMGCDTDDFIHSYEMMARNEYDCSQLEAPVASNHDGYVLDVISL